MIGGRNCFASNQSRYLTFQCSKLLSVWWKSRASLSWVPAMKLWLQIPLPFSNSFCGSWRSFHLQRVFWCWPNPSVCIWVILNIVNPWVRLVYTIPWQRGNYCIFHRFSGLKLFSIARFSDFKFAVIRGRCVFSFTYDSRPWDVLEIMIVFRLVNRRERWVTGIGWFVKRIQWSHAGVWNPITTNETVFPRSWLAIISSRTPCHDCPWRLCLCCWQAIYYLTMLLHGCEGCIWV